MKKILLILFTFLIVSCTSNTLTREFGGKMTIGVPDDCIVKSATWKTDDNSLWVLFERKSDSTCFMKEYSRFGVLEGCVEFK